MKSLKRKLKFELLSVWFWLQSCDHLIALRCLFCCDDMKNILEKKDRGNEVLKRLLLNSRKRK
jgi:hypothetical protein